MEDNVKTNDPLPDSFDTEEEAGAFWDSHSTMDYQENLEPSNDTIELSQRVFEMQGAEPMNRWAIIGRPRRGLISQTHCKVQGLLMKPPATVP
jgi:hypothetical protein